MSDDRIERTMNAVVDRRQFLKLLGVTAAVTACGGAAQPSASPSAPAATATPVTGRISVYSALNESTNNEFKAAFNRAYPAITVDLLPLAAAGELQTRIRAEKASPKADVFIGGSSEFHDPLGKEGLLEPYTSPNASQIQAEAKDPNGNWTGWYFGIFSTILHTDRFNKEVGGAKPQTWDDLLDPKWKQKLILGSPILTGGGYIFLVTQVFRFNKDEDKAIDYMRKFHANVAQYINTSPGAIDLVSQGQYIVCPNWAHDILTARAKNPGVELIIPKDTGFEIGAVSIVKGTKNLQAAKTFVDWTLTKEAGELNVKLSNRVSPRKDVAPAPGAPTLDTVTLVKYDRQWATDNKERLLTKWRQAVGL